MVQTSVTYPQHRCVTHLYQIPIFIISLCLSVSLCLCGSTKAQTWHNTERTIHYQPQGNNFLLHSGTKKFNRALYGTNTAFRVETGDLPEFALYLPGMGGNCKIGIIVNGKSKWLTEANNIQTVYSPGRMLYELKDSLLGKGSIHLSVLALATNEGMIIKAESKNILPKTKLVIVYGGVTGKKFSRDGDIGADPESSFYLQPEYCKDNSYETHDNTFALTYGKDKKLISGIFPKDAQLKIGNANQQQNPSLATTAESDSLQIITATSSFAENATSYFLIQKEKVNLTYNDLEKQFASAEFTRLLLAQTIKMDTPDEYINPLGAALSVAADGIWEDPTYLHGAVAWRMRLPAWRGAYVADPLGWHDRAKKHFSSYLASQVTNIPPGPVIADTNLHIARQLEKMGTSMFSSGYICRNPNGEIKPHHYDMNLVFMDQLFNHFNYTGDIAYVKKCWPSIQLHLEWEKRNYDADDDGLYDAYACIWASDALQYSSGGVTHSSAYNYRANKTAAHLAKLIGEDGTTYEAEANKILSAMNKYLWLNDKGWFAEYKDKTGLQLVHPSAGLWTIYHAIDEQTATPLQQYQMLRYVDNEIPHIPLKAKGLKDENYYVLSTTNWQPYTWSVNNVALAENLHMALAYWQAGENDNAYKLWKSNIVEGMYMSASPGGFPQLLFYDAVRGELYRDFADPIGMAARCLTEGLFGILPDALNDKLLLKPGFPSDWKYATLEVPDISFDYKLTGNTATYTIEQKYSKLLNTELQLKALKDKIVSVTVNGKPAKYKWIVSVARPMISIDAGKQKDYTIKIIWAGNDFEKITVRENNISTTKANILAISDPQGSLKDVTHTTNKLNFTPSGLKGNHSFFITLQQGAAKWIAPVELKAVAEKTTDTTFTTNTNAVYETVNLVPYYNDKLTNIFKNKYMSPRPATTTLQIPWQGIGNWCYPLIQPNINDSGTRAKSMLYLDKIPFATPKDSNNIVFTSQWDNYPDSVIIPLTGKSAHAYLLMTGTTNHQQSRLTNGIVTIQYKDGSVEELELINPTNWYPIEQDYMNDGFAFTTNAPKPYRLILKTGEITKTYNNYTSIKGFTNMAIDGGAATVLDLPLDSNKELESIIVKTLANEVVVGLMSLTLER